METPLVPKDFTVPSGPQSEPFVLEPLHTRHNAADHAAWTSSIEHIKKTPEYVDRAWPDKPVPLSRNVADIATHMQDFADRTGFTYSVLARASGDVIGCVYLYPPRRSGYDVDVSSWVRADHAELDKPLHDVVCHWLAESWPFVKPDYAAR